MRRLDVYKEVPRPKNRNIITPKWVFRRKFENGILIKHKTRLVARGFTQVSGIDYHDAYLYVPVVRLESCRAYVDMQVWQVLDQALVTISTWISSERDEALVRVNERGIAGRGVESLMTKTIVFSGKIPSCAGE